MTGVTVSPSTVALEVGGIQQLDAAVKPSNAANKAVSWSSSDSAVAAVDSSGRLSALTEGTATITATTADGGKTATCTVTVKPYVPVTAVHLDNTSLTMKRGATYPLHVTVYPDNFQDKPVMWSSSKPDTASVDSNGKVTAVAAGKVTIVVTTRSWNAAGDVVSVYSTITVTDG